MPLPNSKKTMKEFNLDDLKAITEKLKKSAGENNIFSEQEIAMFVMGVVSMEAELRKALGL